VRVYRVGRGWWSRCRECPWQGQPSPSIDVARVDGRVHELHPEGANWATVAGWLRAR
jgi:hypothetical protein